MPLSYASLAEVGVREALPIIPDEADVHLPERAVVLAVSQPEHVHGPESPNSQRAAEFPEEQATWPEPIVVGLDDQSDRASERPLSSSEDLLLAAVDVHLDQEWGLGLREGGIKSDAANR